jgi:hypothetical protein
MGNFLCNCVSEEPTAQGKAPERQQRRLEEECARIADEQQNRREEMHRQVAAEREAKNAERAALRAPELKARGEKLDQLKSQKMLNAAKEYRKNAESLNRK